MAFQRAFGVVFSVLAAVSLAGCDGAGGFSLGKGGSGAGSGDTTRLVERDVEAPEVFQVTDSGLWDGRPSLGGVWVAFANVTDPERVIIRNEANGRFVIGALFRREQATPGPALQVSSDAAETLGMLAGQPAKLNVTALRREEVAPEPAPAAAAVAGEAATTGAVETASLEETAGAAIANAEAQASATPAAAPAAAPAATPTAAAAPAASGLAKPFVQIGIFSIEANATATADRLRGAGLVPTVLDQTSRGSRFWRVVVGPTRTSAERAQIVQTVKGLGFTDAYAVSR